MIFVRFEWFVKGCLRFVKGLLIILSGLLMVFLIVFMDV